MTDQRRRRIGGWGFEGESYPPSERMIQWLETATGPATHPMPAGPAAPPSAEARRLPALAAAVSTDPVDRLAHCRGQGLVDVIRLRCGLVPALPDGVCRPTDSGEVAAVLAECSAAGVRIVPWGGGTSVTGGVNVIAGDDPVCTMDLERMAGMTDLDEISGLATFGPGTTGPATEAALNAHGLTLGHFPQSWELSTVGGWVATRSSGQESLGYGRIEDMVAGLEMVAPSGVLQLPARPASAAGPDLRHVVLGSEGRFGVITSAVLRVRRRPAVTRVEAALAPSLEHGLAVVKDLVNRGVPLTMIRLSDATETQVAMAVGLADSPVAPLVTRYLGLRGLGDDSSLMLYGAGGERDDVLEVLQTARATIRDHRGAILGKGPGGKWLHERFRHPYLRESLLDLGWATDTMETSAPWSQVPTVREGIRNAITNALANVGESVPVLCHVSHPYRDGASLYFTFFYRCAANPEETIHRWSAIKRAANDGLTDLEVTLSHHHGVGQWHAPWFRHETGAAGHRILTGLAEDADPAGILNPHVLLDPDDHLES